MLENPPVDAAGSGPVADDDLSMAATPGPSESSRTVVFVAGSAGSGTGLVAGILSRMGLHVPEPAADGGGSVPAGFGAPQWVVDFHQTLLERLNVRLADARPSAWFETGRAGTREHNRAELAARLTEELKTHESLVIRDPRLPWFLGLWRAAAVRAGAATSTIVVLRPPAEEAGSRDDGPRADIGRLAGWTNLMLCTERATRGSARSFVRYHDLLADWTKTVVRVGEELGIAEIGNAGVKRIQEVHDLVDPQPREAAAGWDDLDVPAALREVAQRTWEQLDLLAEPGGDTPDVHARFDQLRKAYADLYADAEALAASSIDAAGPAYVRESRRVHAEQARQQADAAYAAASPARKAYLRTRRAGGRVKRRLQERQGEQG